MLYWHKYDIEKAVEDLANFCPVQGVHVCMCACVCVCACVRVCVCVCVMIDDLSSLTEEWSMEDKVTFEQAFQFHGKNFQRIRTMV